MQKRIVTHGGADTTADMSDGTQRAAEAGWEELASGNSAMAAVVAAVQILETDGRYCAGRGAVRRQDGVTVQLDAACMGSDGEFGAVCAVETVEHPILLAHIVLGTDQILLAGRGADTLARAHNLPEFRHRGRDDDSQGGDTVGAVAFDGENFAAALSTGGVRGAPVGRVGDVPLPGCGLFTGPHGAVITTGDGEDIAKSMLAMRCYDRLLQGESPEAIVKWGMDLLPAGRDIGIVVQNKTGAFADARGGMAVGERF